MKTIKSISVKNSPFYQDFSISFSPKLNCIMGGRGTGKSTLLYLLQSCLVSNIESDDNVYKVLQSNLGLGELNLQFDIGDDKIYTIQKILNENPQATFNASGETKHFDDLAQEIECDFYETSSIEFIGRDSLSRLRLIDKSKKSDIETLLSEILSIQNDLFKNAQTIIHINKQVGFINEQLKQFSSAKADFDQHKKLVPEGISEDEKKEFEKADENEKRRGVEKRFLNKNVEVLNQAQRDSQLIENDLTDYETKLKQIDLDKIFFNKELTKESYDDALTAIAKVKALLGELKRVIDDTNPKFNVQAGKLKELHIKQEAEFVKLKSKYEKRRSYFETFNTLSKKVAKKEELESNLEDLTKKLHLTKDQRINLIERLNGKKNEILKIRQGVISQLNSLFDGDIKITLTAGGIKDEFENKLKKLLVGAGRHYTELIPRIIQRFTPDDLAKAINEKDLDSLTTIEGIDEQRGNVLIGLSEKQEVYDIESLYCPDLPVFYLRVIESGEESSNYRRSEDLSMGQRCTTVLPIVFSVSSNPLIIDQPEDNLDNRYIADRIHKIIRQQKDSRQIIFVTHNPNIPVLADSEKNIFLSFENQSEIERMGTVDEVKDSIIRVLEGGSDAFVKRKEKYNL